MKSIEEILLEKKDSQDKAKDQKRLSSTISASFTEPSTLIRTLLNEVQINNDLQGAEMSRLISEVIKSVEKVSNLESLEKAVSQLSDELKSIPEQIKQIKIDVPNVPDITIPDFPTITVPEPKVTVNVPKIELPDFPAQVAPIVNIDTKGILEALTTLQKAVESNKPSKMISAPPIDLSPLTEALRAEEETKCVGYDSKYDNFGNLVELTELYEDGTRRIATGFQTGSVRIKYA